MTSASKSGLRAVVTGGTSGIGRAIVQRLAADGARVISVGRRAEGPSNDGVIRFSADVREPEDVRALGDAVARHFDALDLLVCCAGIQRTHAIAEGMDLEEVESEVAVNLLGPVRVTAALLPLLLRSERATVVNVTSVLALQPKSRAPLYGATKAALASWTRALRHQLEPHGVRVVELMPPLVATPMTAGRDEGALPPEAVADALLTGLRTERDVIAVGRARLARALQRFVPGRLAAALRDS